MAFKNHFVPKGECVVREGEKGAEAYLIQSGEVEVSSGTGGKRSVLGTLGPGEIIGEMALFRGGYRTATVKALKDCNLVIITRETLEDKIRKTDPTIQAIVRMAFKRLDDVNKIVSEHGIR